MSSNYEPEVDDYVIWKRESWTGMMRDEGWVYFKAPKFEKKKGFNEVARYITIETGVHDKPKDYDPDLPHVNNNKKNHPKHEKVHTLLLCYEQHWKDLKFVKRRKTKNCEHYSQYDDVN